MEITKENLTLQDGLSKEWILTNGIGGYASSTVLGANTRKYHGLLVAPITPPARRFLTLSKLNESITIGKKKYDLFTDVCEDYISDGYKSLESFTKEYVPIFKYKVDNVEITKLICMEYGKNTVGVYYKIKNKDKKSKLEIAPIVNFRDFHTVNTDTNFEVKQTLNGNKVKLIINSNIATPLYMNLSEGIYNEEKNNIFRNMFYTEEQKRGFDPIENHIIPGIYEIELKENEEKEISFVFSLEENIEEINVKDLIDKEIIRLNEIFNQSLLIDNRKEKKSKKELEKDEEIQNYLIAADNFLVYRPSFGYHTLIAGYPWFLDWGRDSMISFEGLLLIPKRFKKAREVLLTTVRDIKYGLVPNGYSGFDNRPLYNSADASLLLFEQVQKYLDYTEDYDFIRKNIYEKLEEILENYINGINVDNNNIYLDEDNLIVSGTPDTQNTWMDVKIGNHAVTPRNGKTVEINSLWYNALIIMSNLSNKYGKKLHSKHCRTYAENTKKAFNEKFYNIEKKCLYDVLDDEKIRPNQLFALSLSNPIIDPKSEIAKNIIDIVENELLNDYGLKTLAKGEENYVEIYEGNEEKRDLSYHQGITWPWLLGLYYNALKNIKKSLNKKEEKEIENKILKFREKTQKVFKKELYENGCIGSIAEIYDSTEPHLPKGTFAQAWSVAEIFRIVLGK